MGVNPGIGLQIREAADVWRRGARRSPIAKNGAYSLIGYVLPAVAMLVATPVLLHKLGATDYGLWVLASSFLGMAGVADLGLSTAASKFIAHHVAQGNLRRAASSATTGALLYLAIGSILSATLFVLAPSIASLLHAEGASSRDVATVVRIASLGLLPMFLVNAGMAIPIGLQDFKRATVIVVLQPVLNLGLSVGVVYAGGSFRGVVVATVVSLWVSGIVSLGLGYALLRRLRAPLGASRSQLREIGSFVAFSSMTGIGNVLFAFADRIAVAAVLGVSAVAYYSVATGVAINLLRVAGVITKPLMPATSSRAGTSEWTHVKRLMYHATGAVGALELLGCGILLAASGPLVEIWLGHGFGSHVLTPFRILVVVFALAAVGAPAFQIANGIGAPWVPALAGVVGGGLTILLIFMLAPTWGVAGAAAANAGGLTALFPLFYLLRRLRQHEGLGAERLAVG